MNLEIMKQRVNFYLKTHNVKFSLIWMNDLGNGECGTYNYVLRAMGLYGKSDEEIDIWFNLNAVE